MSSNNIDLNGIKRFRRGLKQIRTNTQETKKNSMSLKFGGIAHEILSETYRGSRFKVTEPEYNEKGLVIYAKGYGISFDEFGTGIYAKNTYKGKLPTQAITFPTIVGRDSNGKAIKGHMTTMGWEYYYDNPFTKLVLDGKLGWWVGSNLGFQTGREASNRFYNSCRLIRMEIKREIKENNK